MVLVEGTSHTMYTTETLLAFLDMIPETGPVELHQGHLLVEANVDPLLPQTEQFAMSIIC